MFGKKIKLDNQKEISIFFWDLFHQYRYESLNKIFFKGADGFMLTYDMTQRKTYDKMKELLNTIRDYIGEDIPIALVSCKIDLFNEEIRREEAENFARQNSLIFYETSAKENIVDFCFNDFISRIIPKIENNNNNKINIKKERPAKKGCLK